MTQGMLHSTMPFSVARSMPSTESIPIELREMTRQRVSDSKNAREIELVAMTPSASRTAASTRSGADSRVTLTRQPARSSRATTSGPEAGPLESTITTVGRSPAPAPTLCPFGSAAAVMLGPP